MLESTAVCSVVLTSTVLHHLSTQLNTLFDVFELFFLKMVVEKCIRCFVWLGAVAI